MVATSKKGGFYPIGNPGYSGKDLVKIKLFLLYYLKLCHFSKQLQQSVFHQMLRKTLKIHIINQQTFQNFFSYWLTSKHSYTFSIS